MNLHTICVCMHHSILLSLKLSNITTSPTVEAPTIYHSLKKPKVYPMPHYRHIVLLQFRPDVPPSEIESIFSSLSALQQKIPGLISFSGGIYSSPEGMNKGYTHAFTMDFASLEERDAYFPHPEHELVKDMILPKIVDGGVVAFDFEL